MRRLHPQDVASGLVSGLVSFAVYAWTAAPNVTLLDSGEFIVAAQHFGVPHPTGYPLWTLLAWLFQLLPLGNAAWEINLFSGVCGALAVGLCAGMLTNLLRWFLDPLPAGLLRSLPVWIGVSFGLMFAFSVSMWSQAVIAEVYTLHALLTAAYLALLYGWVRHPSRDRLMLWAFFVLALSFSNHHLIITLAPLPFLLILLLRRRALPDWIFAGALTALLAYLGLAILSEELPVLKTALRLFYVVAAAGLVFVLWRRGRVRWKVVAFLPVAVAAGLLPYAYMPLASSTNPPMNWAYTREAKGFFYSINRSQYGGRLTDQSLRALGRLMGTRSLAQPPTASEDPAGPGTLEAAQLWVGFFWQQLARAFTPFSLIGYFASIFFILRAPLSQRTWIYLLHFGFIAAAFLQPVVDGAAIDRAGWWLQMPYHAYTNLIYALLAGLGWGLLIARLSRRRRFYAWLAPASLLLPLLTVAGSEPEASQRGRWFGWMYGRDMLAGLPPGSVMIGGTDPGRFVPTYMIFGESPQDARHKKDGSFDRRDLYIITQNALGDDLYMKYLRDHYSESRPEVRNAFERWLGRATTYPEKPLKLPSTEEIAAAVEAAVTPAPETGKPLEEDIAMAPFSATFHWIWTHNKDSHTFFVEESFPMKWTYDYAVPHGLVYRMNPTKVETWDAETVARDMAFWHGMVGRLTGDPEYLQDFDAQRSFSKLRVTGGNLYGHREMPKEAEAAYLQALKLWPASPEALIPLVNLYWDAGRFGEVEEMIATAFEQDPNNRGLVQLAYANQVRWQMSGELAGLRERALSGDDAAAAKVVAYFSSTGERDKGQAFARELIETRPTNEKMLRVLANYTALDGFPAEHLQVAVQVAAVLPEDHHAQFLLARAYLVEKQTNAAATAAARAIELGGRLMREQMLADPVFQAARTDAAFGRLLGSPAASEREEGGPGGSR